MKRSQAVKMIKKTLQKWENSKLDTNCAKEVLSVLEEAGLICPPEVVVARVKVPNEKKTKPLYGMEWEPEKKTKLPVKVMISK